MTNSKAVQPEKRWDWSVRLVKWTVFQAIFNNKRMKKGNLRPKKNRQNDSNQIKKNQKTEISSLQFYNPLIINTRNALGTTNRNKECLA